MPIQGSHLPFAEPVIPTSKTRRLGAWAPSVQEEAEARRMGPHAWEMPAPPRAQFPSNARKGNRSKACGPIGCKEAVRAEIAPARREASREGNIVWAIPRACLRGIGRTRPSARLCHIE